MKTLEQIKYEVAIKHGYENFEQVITDIDLDKLSGNTVEYILNECMQEHAKQMCIKQKQLCYVDYNNDKNVLDTPLATDNK